MVLIGFLEPNVIYPFALYARTVNHARTFAFHNPKIYIHSYALS